jgi:hypothetical protein
MARSANKRLTTRVVQLDLRDLKAHGWSLTLPGGSRAERLDEHVLIDLYGKRFIVSLTQTTPQFGGQRFWFSCPTVRPAGAHSVFSRLRLPALFWASASVYAANDGRKGDPPSCSAPKRPGRKRESAGAVPAQTRGHATRSVAEVIFQMRAVGAEGHAGCGRRA